MGQSGSMPGKKSSSALRRSFRSPFPRRLSRPGQGSLSATFNYVQSELKVNQVNVNLATEEELMTLPGVTRTVARNIVEYRQAIGRFNKVEDLALVSGIGADRLDQIRPEICVNKRRNHSFPDLFRGIGTEMLNLSRLEMCLIEWRKHRAQSIDSLSSSGTDVSPQYSRGQQSPPPPPPPALLDVNTATVFQLMGVRGINQELAAAIVDYRDRRGDFFTLDDLIKVKGLNQMKLNALRPKLTVMSDLKYDIKKPTPQSKTNNNNGSTTATTNYCNGVGNMSSVGVKEVYEVVSALCERPLASSVAAATELPKNNVRIATWNMSDMSKDKADNPAVREVFCLTVLENKFSCVVLQGLEDSGALQQLCDEFKTPVCKRVMDWKSSRGDWKSEFVPIQRNNGYFNLGFLYNAQVVDLSSVKLVQDNSMIRAATANMTFNGMSISILNVHLASISSESTFNTLVASLKPSVLMGDFTVITTLDKGTTTLSSYKQVLPGATSTKCLPQQGVFYYDNIYIRDSLLPKYSGNYGVVRSGLCHLAIPKGWNWNGPVSEHCPVWTQLTA